MGLGVGEKTAAADACRMEHDVSRESYEALKKPIAETMEKVPMQGVPETMLQTLYIRISKELSEVTK